MFKAPPPFDSVDMTRRWSAQCRVRTRFTALPPW